MAVSTCRRVYNAVFRVVTPKATRVIDRFHVMRHAISAVDEVRRRVQQQHHGHRGRSGRPALQGPQAPRDQGNSERPRAVVAPGGAARPRRSRGRSRLRLRRQRSRRSLLRNRRRRRSSRPLARHHRAVLEEVVAPRGAHASPAPCATGSIRSSPGTPPESPTVPPRA